MHFLARLVTVVALGALVPGAEFARPLVCYYEAWSAYRLPPNTGDPAKIPVVNGCNHIIYAFLGLDESTNTVKYLDTWQDLDKGAIAAVVGLKKENPELKTTFAVGGWNEGSEKYSRMASTEAGRNAFANSVAGLIKKHGFDGVDLDWEYPTQRGGAPGDRENFVLLLKAIRKAIGADKLLTIAASANPNMLAATYDVPAISEVVSYIHVMAYDLRGSWDPTVDIHSLLNGRSTDSEEFKPINVRGAMAAWAKQGAPKNKLIMGFGFYGRSFALKSAAQNEVGSPAAGGGNAGPVSQTMGILFYMEICQRLNGGWTRRWDSVGQVPYAFFGNQWVGYDDPEGFKYKVDLINAEGYAGAMVYSVGQDDLGGACGNGRYPLLTALSGLLNGDGPVPTTRKPDPTPTEGPAPVTTDKPDPTQTEDPVPDPTHEPTETLGPEPTEEPTEGPAPVTTEEPTEKPSPAPTTSEPAPVTCEKSTYPHKELCTKFYICDSATGTMTEMNCAVGTVFNEDTGLCDWAVNTHPAPPNCPDFA